jgi:hypothetical protein
MKSGTQAGRAVAIGLMAGRGAPKQAVSASVVSAQKKTASPARSAKAATIEDRLESKATAADHRSHAGERSLGQMTREERRKLLYGDG